MTRAGPGRQDGGTSVRPLLRRLRATAGDLALLCVLALVGALLVSGVPRFADHLAVQALRADIARAPAQTRDLRISQQPLTLKVEASSFEATRSLDLYQSQLPAPLAGAVQERWFAASLPGQGGRTVVPSGPRAEVGLRVQSGLTEAADLVAGRWPATGQDDVVLQIALSTQIAQMFAMRVGDQLRFGPAGGGGPTVRLVGLFRPHDITEPFWLDVPEGARVLFPFPETPFFATAFTDPVGLRLAASRMGRPSLTWRYRFDEGVLAEQPVESLITAVLKAQRDVGTGDTAVGTGLAGLLEQYQRQQRASRSLLLVVGTGLLLPLLGATVLAARLAAERRRQEYALLRARGAGAPTIGARALLESALTVPVAVGVGWLLGASVSGRAHGTDAAVLGVLAVAVLAAPALAVAAVRSTALDTTRRDLARLRPSPGRLTAESSVLVIALIGVYLLRRRGLVPQQGTDAFLASVPVLLAAGAALLTLRLLPWPVRVAAGLAGRTRGVVAFLSLNQVARSAAVHGAPLAVLVVALTTGLFTGAVATGVSEARDRVTDRDVGADAQLVGDDFAADTAGRLTAVPGVDAVAGVSVEVDAAAYPTGRPALTMSVPVVVLDPAEYQRVLDRSGIRTVLPDVLTRARRDGGPVPAVVSPAVAAELGGPGTRTVAVVRGRPYDVTVAAVAAEFPGLGVRARRFVVLPRQALPPTAVIVANRYLLAGDDLDAAAVRAAGDAGQLAYVRGELGREPDGLDRPSTLLTWDEARQAADRTGSNSVLSFTFAIGVLGSTALALLAVGLAVLVGAYPRGQMLSRLRTMGLAAGTGRRLLVAELAPMVCLAVLVGAALGIALPALLRPALDLTVFTAGVAPRTRVDPLLGAALPVLVVLALTVAVGVESMVNRRLRLGEALRISEER